MARKPAPKRPPTVPKTDIEKGAIALWGRISPSTGAGPWASASETMKDIYREDARAVLEAVR